MICGNEEWGRLCPILRKANITLSEFFAWSLGQGRPLSSLKGGGTWVCWSRGFRKFEELNLLRLVHPNIPILGIRVIPLLYQNSFGIGVMLSLHISLEILSLLKKTKNWRLIFNTGYPMAAGLEVFFKSFYGGLYGFHSSFLVDSYLTRPIIFFF